MFYNAVFEDIMDKHASQLIINDKLLLQLNLFGIYRHILNIYSQNHFDYNTQIIKAEHGFVTQTQNNAFLR
jgi:hypothetical protein